ncbi:uncharacterized protein LOC142350483 [Convolutriloba macropyga]|uniref:uncharacterized protein LOC142350483 n=1 Tax=Convolutriloba macropyga TaxID=536237 RepID=UPI003F523A49
MSGGFKALFLGKWGDLLATPDMSECNTDSITDTTDILRGTSVADKSGIYFTANGVFYGITGRLFNSPSALGGVLTAVDHSDQQLPSLFEEILKIKTICDTRNILEADFHARAWASDSDSCYMETGRIGNFGSSDLFSPTEWLVINTPCIHGFLADVRFQGVLDDNKHLVGEFANMRECATKVQETASAFAAVMENPYESHPPYQCYAINYPTDYATVNLVQDSGYMTCYLKDRSSCPANDYAPQSPGAWIRGVQPSSAAHTQSRIAISERGHCIKVLVERYGTSLIGYAAYRDKNGLSWCIPFQYSDTIEFIDATQTVRFTPLWPWKIHAKLDIIRAVIWPSVHSTDWSMTASVASPSMETDTSAQVVIEILTLRGIKIQEDVIHQSSHGYARLNFQNNVAVSSTNVILEGYRELCEQVFDSNYDSESLSAKVQFGETPSILNIDSGSECSIITKTLAKIILKTRPSARWIASEDKKDLITSSNEPIKVQGNSPPQSPTRIRCVWTHILQW